MNAYFSSKFVESYVNMSLNLFHKHVTKQCADKFNTVILNQLPKLKSFILLIKYFCN